MFSSRFSLPCRHILAAAFEVCIAAPAHSDRRLPDLLAGLDVLHEYNFMEFLTLHLIGERWSLPKSDSNAVVASSSKKDGIVIGFDSTRRVETSSQTQTGREASVAERVNSPDGSEESITNSLKAQMRSWCTKASRDPCDYQRKDFPFLDSAESRRQIFGSIASLERELASLCSSSEGGVLCCGKIGKLLSELVAGMSHIAGRSGSIAMAAHLDNIIDCFAKEALTDPAHTDEPVVLPVVGDAERFRVIKRDDIGEHVDKAFQKRNSDDSAKREDRDRNDAVPLWCAVSIRKFHQKRVKGLQTGQNHLSKKRRLGVKNSYSDANISSLRSECFGRDQKPEGALEPQDGAVVLETDENPSNTFQPLRNPQLRRSARRNNPANVAAHKARPSRKCENETAARIPVRRRTDTNNIPL